MDLNQLSLTHILRYLPGYVYWKNTDSVYMGCNDNFAKAAGLNNMAEIVGKTDYDLAWGNTEAELFRQSDQDVFAGHSKYNFEEPQRMADGKTATVLATKVPLFDAQHRIVGVLGIYSDITERKKAEIALLELKEKAEESISEKTEFIRNMSHDLRTPISGIIGIADIVARQTTEQYIQDSVRDIETAARALLNFFNQIIETAELDLGELPDQNNHFSLKSLQRNIIKIFTPAIKQKNILIESYFDQSIPAVMIGNDAFLYRILLNLTANAVKFTDKGKISIEMTLERKTMQHAVIQISIKDTGKGIPKDKQAKIFEKFNRLTPSNENIYKGSGLGLYMVSKYLQRIGGEIYVDSRPNLGSRFTCFIPFKLPLSETFAKAKPANYIKTQANAINQAISNLDPIAQSCSLDQKPMTKPRPACNTLLVEDNPLAIKIAKFNLSQWGYCVTIARNAQEAEDLLNRTRFDMIYLDLGLPGKNGLDIAKELRANSNALNRHTPIIALTAHADERSKMECMASGINEVLTKPLEEKDARRLTHLVQNHTTELPVVDWTLWNNRCHQHQDLMQEAIKTVCRDLPLFEQSLYDAMANHNLDAIRDTLHTCLGMLRFCALPRLEQTVTQFHDAVRNEPEAISTLFETFRVESSKALAAVHIPQAL